MLTSGKYHVLLGRMKEIRFNANAVNSENLRATKRDYQKKFSPAKLSLHALANLCIHKGLEAAKSSLNLNAK